MPDVLAPTAALHFPPIIQGGMGIGVSNWALARSVSMAGHLGVVSGTAIDTVFVRRLQDGDPEGHTRRAMAHFPMPGVAEAARSRYFIEGGREAGTPYKMLPMYRKQMTRARIELAMLSAFVEVWLAKEGHDNPVGMNLLTKVQMPNLALLYGAMLAGVDAILMGAGIPRDIPGALDALATHQPAVLKLDVERQPRGEETPLTLTPADHWEATPAPLHRPAFLAIVSSHSLATMMARKASGRVDGFIVEGPTAGGHNAPPRGAMKLDESGEPIYGERDAVNLDVLCELGLPFWLAGSVGHPDRLKEALSSGAQGIQVGTLFAYCDESGFTADVKRSVLDSVVRGELVIRTDPRASPTGYPFKVVQLSENEAPPPARERVCDIGGLRVAYQTPDGKVGYRCPAEPVEAYVQKGGAIEDTVGRECLCNALLSVIGQPQVRTSGAVEPPLITSGDDLAAMGQFLEGRTSYSAQAVLDWLVA
ncbi:MAG: nitronate monooxygenase [Rubricoccaceae bacterium]